MYIYIYIYIYIHTHITSTNCVPKGPTLGTSYSITYQQKGCPGHPTLGTNLMQ